MSDYDQEALRELAGRLFGNDREPPAQSGPAGPTEPITGPVIPGQEQAPNLTKGPSVEERWANKIFNADTIREYY